MGRSLRKGGGVILQWCLKKRIGARGMDESKSGEGELAGFVNMVIHFWVT